MEKMSTKVDFSPYRVNKTSHMILKVISVFFNCQILISNNENQEKGNAADICKKFAHYVSYLILFIQRKEDKRTKI